MTTVDKFLAECDALIVTGTFSKNDAGRKIIDECIRRQDVPVIEINPETFIRNGFVAQVNMKAEVALPILFKEFYRQKKEELTKPKKWSPVKKP